MEGMEEREGMEGLEDLARFFDAIESSPLGAIVTQASLVNICGRWRNQALIY